jgi:hypothetical protein
MLPAIHWPLSSIMDNIYGVKANLTSKKNNQECPNEASWTIWGRFLNTISNFHGYLYRCLGDWLQ